MENNDDFNHIKSLGFPPVWDEIITRLWWKDAKRVRHTGHINYIQSKKWFWLNRPDTDIFGMIRFILEEMIAYPSITISQLLSHYIEETTGKLVLPDKEENRIRKSISRAIKRLVENHVINTLHIDADETGKFSCCLYNAPFADSETIQKTKQDHLNIGGGGKKVKKSMSEDEYASKMANRGPLIREKKKQMEKTSEVAYCEKCKMEYTVKFTGERCMNCDDNFSRVSILKNKKIET